MQPAHSQHINHPDSIQTLDQRWSNVCANVEITFAANVIITLIWQLI